MIEVSPPLVALVAALAVFLFFLGFAQRNQDRETRERLGRYVGKGDKGKKEVTVEPGTSAATQALDKMVANRGFAANLRRELGRADLKLTVGEYMAVTLMSVVGAVLVGIVLFRNLVLGLAFSIVGFYLPRIYVRMRQGSRLSAFNNQLSDTITMLANSLRSGYSLGQGMELVSREAPPPTCDEFRRVVQEMGLGLSSEEALNNMLKRVPSDDLDLMITAINVQHEVGGNLAQILDGIATTIRERVRIKGEIKTLTTQQTYSGYIITALPFALGGIIFMLNPKYMSGLIETPCGWLMMGVGGVMIFSAYIIIRKIVNIEV